MISPDRDKVDPQFAGIVDRSNAAAAQMREGMERMQAALDDAWDWYEAVRDEASAALGTALAERTPTDE